MSRSSHHADLAELTNRLRGLIRSKGMTVLKVATALNKPGLRNRFTAKNLGSLRLEQILEILTFLGVPATSFFRSFEIGPVGEPLALLRQYRLSSRPKSPQLRRWLDLPVAQSLDGSWNLPKESDEINRLRLQSSELAETYAERWANETYNNLAKSPNSKRLAEHTASLVSWASVVRHKGETSDACFAIERALEYHASRSGQLWSHLLYASALLMRDFSGLDGCKDALILANEGAALAEISLGSEDKAKHYTLLAMLHYYLGNSELSLHAVRKAERNRDTSSIAKLLPLVQIRCLVLCEAGRPVEARETLNQVSFSKLPASFKWPYHWLEARIDASFGNLLKAKHGLLEVLDSPGSELSPLTRMLVFCDLAKILVALREDALLQALSGQFLSRLPELELSPTAFQIANSLLTICGGSRPSKAALSSAYRSLRALPR